MNTLLVTQDSVITTPNTPHNKLSIETCAYKKCETRYKKGVKCVD